MSLSSIDKFVQGRLDDAYYTPDTPKIYQTKWHSVFVYGTLKRGFSRHGLIDQCPFVGPAFTRMTGWTLYRTNKVYSYPVMLPVIDSEQPGAVLGEVYLVPPEIIRELDFIESNGIQYSRDYRTVDIYNRTGEAMTMAAWMYVGNREAWKNAIVKKGLLPCEHYSQKNKANFKYFIFKEEYDAPLPQPVRNL